MTGGIETDSQASFLVAEVVEGLIVDAAFLLIVLAFATG